MAVSVLLEGRLPSLNSQLVPDISQLLGSASRFAHPSCIRSEHASHFSLRALESWVQVDQIALASACLHNLDGATFLERRRRLIDEVGLFVCLSILCLCCFHVTAHGVHRWANLCGHDMPFLITSIDRWRFWPCLLRWCGPIHEFMLQYFLWVQNRVICCLLLVTLRERSGWSTVLTKSALRWLDPELRRVTPAVHIAMVVWVTRDYQVWVSFKRYVTLYGRIVIAKRLSHLSVLVAAWEFDGCQLFLTALRGAFMQLPLTRNGEVV